MMFCNSNFFIALTCCFVAYPNFLSQEYLVNSFDIFVINLSLATLAIIDAAEISDIFWSPLITDFKLYPDIFGNLFPSINTKVGLDLSFFIDLSLLINLHLIY